MNYIEMAATISTFVAVYLLSLPKRKGYTIATISQILWIIFSLQNKHYILAIQAVVLIGVNFYGIHNWKKKGIGD